MRVPKSIRAKVYKKIYTVCNDSGNVKISFICACAEVSPIKRSDEENTIPRNELQGAVLLADLMEVFAVYTKQIR